MLLLVTALFAQDTVRIDPYLVLARALERSPAIAAGTAEMRAADATVRVAGRLANPHLAVVAENLGIQREVTGKDGLAGTEGQVTLQTSLPLGGDLGADRRVALAGRDAARAGALQREAEFRVTVLQTIARHQSLQTTLAAAQDEVAALRSLADAVTAQAADGRAPEGTAARFRVEAASAEAQAAHRRVEAAAVRIQLATWLGLRPETPLVIPPAMCTPDGAASGVPSDLLAADARVARTEATVDLARARRMPDLLPQVGFRRTAGFSGLLVGLGFEVPVFHRGGAALDAARASREAAELEREAMERRLSSEVTVSRLALTELEVVAPAFGTEWREDLDLAVRAAEARWTEGGGTLADLFDARRARQVALRDEAAWRVARVTARLALARASGFPLDASLLSDDCPGASR